MTQIEIGRLLRAGTTGFIAGCRVSQFTVPAFGELVRAPLGDSYQVYGLIHDIHIDDEGVRQLVTLKIQRECKDNRERRMSVEMSVLTVAMSRMGDLSLCRPPPLTWTASIEARQMCRFTSVGVVGLQTFAGAKVCRSVR